MNEARSGSRPVRRWKVLVAHDATAPTCDALILGVERAYGNVEIIDASSVEDALYALHSTGDWSDVGVGGVGVGGVGDGGVGDGGVGDGGVGDPSHGVDLCLVCLDLPPVPQGGIRLAEEVMAAGVPLVLVTRSLRWLPVDADRLRAQPWVSPEAEDIELARAMGDAIARRGLTFDGEGALDGAFDARSESDVPPGHELADELAEELALDDGLARASQVG